jgi:hypothetical protein
VQKRVTEDRTQRAQRVLDGLRPKPAPKQLIIESLYVRRANLADVGHPEMRSEVAAEVERMDVASTRSECILGASLDRQLHLGLEPLARESVEGNGRFLWRW